MGFVCLHQPNGMDFWVAIDCIISFWDGEICLDDVPSNIKIKEKANEIAALLRNYGKL